MKLQWLAALILFWLATMALMSLADNIREGRLLWAAFDFVVVIAFLVMAIILLSTGN